MAITKSYSDSNGANIHSAQGRYLDDAATPALAVIEVGFKPRYFVWENLTDRIKWEWYEGMAAGTTIKTVAAGTRTLDTADVAISPAADSGSQDGSQGTVDATNAGVRNNVAYPGPSTIVNSTATDLPGTKGGGNVTIAAAVILQSKQYNWVAVG